MDLVSAARVAVLGHRVDEHALGPVLALLGAEEDAHRGTGRGLASGLHAQLEEMLTARGQTIEDAIRAGTIFDSKTLSAWACYRLMAD